MISRRRMITISAAVIGAGALWQAREARHVLAFRAFGTEAQITLRGAVERAQAVGQAIRAEVAQIERSLSLYDPQSELSRLNREGQLVAPSEHLRRVMTASHEVYIASDGLFDPTIQTFWHGGPRSARFSEVELSANVLRSHGHQLSFNGIAQGYASDRIADLLRDYGFEDVLVSVGEFRALGGPWYIAQTRGQPLRLSAGAVATSAQNGSMRPDGTSHLIHPHTGQGPLWQEVTVVADHAIYADAWSTALSFMDRAQIAQLDRAGFGLRRVNIDAHAVPLSV